MSRRAARKAPTPFAIAEITPDEARERYPHVMDRVAKKTMWICTTDVIGWDTDDVGGMWITHTGDVRGWRSWLSERGCTNPEVLVASIDAPALVIGNSVVRIARVMP